MLNTYFQIVKCLEARSKLAWNKHYLDVAVIKGNFDNAREQNRFSQNRSVFDFQRKSQAKKSLLRF